MSVKRRILIVEDSKELVDILRKRLCDGYQVSCALDGVTGFESFKEFKPDVVLLDISLPGANGFEVLKEIRLLDSNHETVVLIITALSESSKIVEGLSLGADDYLVKPFKLVELEARIKSHLTIKDLQKKLVDMERLSALHETVVGISHEINNPLMSISAFANFLKNTIKGGNKEQVDSIEGIISGVERISEILKKLSAAKSSSTVDYRPGIKMIDLNRI